MRYDSKFSVDTEMMMCQTWCMCEMCCMYMHRRVGSL